MNNRAQAPYEDRFLVAQQKHGEARYDEAIVDYRQLLVEQPEDLAVKVALGGALLHKDRDVEAAPLLREVWEAAPDDVAANYYWGQYSNRQGDHTRAYECFLRTVAAEPGHLLATKGLATLCLYRGNLDEAYHWLGSLQFFHPSAKLGAIKPQLEMLLGKRNPKRQFFCAKAKVFSRSSISQDGPPGERDILALNPDRFEGIVNLCGWSRLEPGTLNLALKFDFAEAAKWVAPAFYEAAADVVYPPAYESIPRRRIGYWYYRGYLYNNGAYQPMLLRRAVTPNSEEVAEVFAEHSLRETLALSDGQTVLCYLASSEQAMQDDAWLACRLKAYDLFFDQTQQFGRRLELYQGHEGWQLPGQRPTLHRFEQYALGRWLTPTARVLDIGCNIGCFGIEVASNVGSYVGFDINASLIEVAKTLADYHQADNCEFRTASFEDFRSSDPGQFDLIFSFAVHVWIGKPMRDYVSDLKAMLNPGGIIVIESNDLVRNDSQFFANMSEFIREGFFLLYKGKLKDDGVINRGFCVFQLL
ncbi:methyltransferase domain-containing protein [Pseudomonas typographi]|uniref:methyltransferase domain-containing protein n=1 Tax=Pseudomonas typographi TaxID=2715964 RepID=UPI00168510DA|nr:methyltransferase domain-containing protein [Pseudomonas typographi]MBD1550667.1 methyltransferase domain-containing protein [Pseudomonas typographi]